MINLKKKNKLQLYLFALIVIYIIPCSFFNFLDNVIYLNVFRILCAGALIYASQQNINTLICIFMCVFLLYSKVNNICGLRFREGMFSVLPPVTPYVNKPIYVPMDVTNKSIQGKVNYERFFENVTSDGIMGKYNINQDVPKHHDYRNKLNLDRLIKIEGEVSSNMSRGEKYYRHKRGFFSMF